MRRRIVLAAIALAAALSPSLAETLSIEEYVSRLLSIEAALREGEIESARASARVLAECRISFGEDLLDPDQSVLAPVEAAASPAAARRAAAGIAALVAALESANHHPDDGSTGDAALLEDIRRARSLAEIAEGGEVSGTSLGRTDFWKGVTSFVESSLERIADMVDGLRRWLSRLWPATKGSESATSVYGVPLMVIAFIIVSTALLVTLALYALRQARAARGGTIAASSGVARAAGDEDPLSRDQGEWERYAEELAAAGRAREAIRAWYHAVLVALFRRGLLHHRRGRTNWEYVSAAPHAAVWRAAFVEITRRFEREWYGRTESVPEELEACADGARGLLLAVRGEGARP